jgi:hypothetical protein
MRQISVVVVLCMIAIARQSMGQPATQPAIDPKAEQVLRQACQTVAGLKQFTFEAHSTYEVVLKSGEKVTFAQNQEMVVRRPDALAMILQGDREDLRFWYDGKRAGMYNAREKTFSVTDAPATIDATLDLLAEKHGMTLPLADAVLSDPYKALAERVQSGKYVGTGYVFDAVCHHLAFREEEIDWEVWIDAGKQALPRKLVIRHKKVAECPEFTAFLQNWDVSPKFSDATFRAPAVKDAKELPFRAAPATQSGPAGK